MSEIEDYLKHQMSQDRRFQDSKHQELSYVHKVLNDESLTQDEKYVCLIQEGKFGTQRAQELVYGKVIYKDEPYQNPTYKPYYFKEHK